ncbi:MAG: pseudoazurin [Pseudomonadota bacterium]
MTYTIDRRTLMLTAAGIALAQAANAEEAATPPEDAATPPAEAEAPAEEAAPAPEEAAAEDAGPTVHEVPMLNQNPDNPRQRMVFLPRVLAVKPGDTVVWLPTDPGHNSQSTDGMIPEGVEGWLGKFNKEVSFTFEKPGIYGYQCKPHLAAGMVGLIVCEGEGQAHNLEAAKQVKQIGLAKKVWGELWAEAEEMGLIPAAEA